MMFRYLPDAKIGWRDVWVGTYCLFHHFNSRSYTERPWKNRYCHRRTSGRGVGPVAGTFASLLFSLGVVGTGVLAVPVLGVSAAYAVGEAFRWPVGLERKAKEAKAFYAVLVVATLIGLGLKFTKIDPIRALVWSAMINDVTAPPVMVFMMLMVSNQRVMGKLTLPIYLKILGWAATLIIALAANWSFSSGRQLRTPNAKFFQFPAQPRTMSSEYHTSTRRPVSRRKIEQRLKRLE